MSRRHPTVRRVLHEGRGDTAQRDLLFRNLRLPNGTRKTTWAHRLTDVDERIVHHLAGHRGPLRVLDVAVSSGVSTIELLDALVAAGHEPDATATDLLTHGVLVRVVPGLWAFTDEAGEVVQWDLAGIGLRARSTRRSGAAASAALGATHRAATAVGVARPVGRVALVHPDLPGRARLAQEDLLAPDHALDGPYDLVRAANIVNRDYFDDAQLVAAARTLGRRLVDGGLLVVVRTTAEGQHRGTLWRRRDGRLVVVEHLGRPSDLDGLGVEDLELGPPLPIS